VIEPRHERGRAQDTRRKDSSDAQVRPKGRVDVVFEVFLGIYKKRAGTHITEHRRKTDDHSRQAEQTEIIRHKKPGEDDPTRQVQRSAKHIAAEHPERTMKDTKKQFVVSRG
jgi:hypothetical protein